MSRTEAEAHAETGEDLMRKLFWPQLRHSTNWQEESMHHMVLPYTSVCFSSEFVYILFFPGQRKTLRQRLTPKPYLFLISKLFMLSLPFGFLHRRVWDRLLGYSGQMAFSV